MGQGTQSRNRCVPVGGAAAPPPRWAGSAPSLRPSTCPPPVCRSCPVHLSPCARLRAPPSAGCVFSVCFALCLSYAPIQATTVCHTKPHLAMPDYTWPHLARLQCCSQSPLRGVRNWCPTNLPREAPCPAVGQGQGHKSWLALPPEVTLWTPRSPSTAPTPPSWDTSPQGGDTAGFC